MTGLDSQYRAPSHSPSLKTRLSQNPAIKPQHLLAGRCHEWQRFCGTQKGALHTPGRDKPLLLPSVVTAGYLGTATSMLHVPRDLPWLHCTCRDPTRVLQTSTTLSTISMA